MESALRFREIGRLEAGDCWCHRSCYEAKPQTGCRLFPRQASSQAVAHFWRGPGTFSKTCEYEIIRGEVNESQRYAQFYHDLRAWLNTTQALDDLDAESISESKSRKYSDFIIKHAEDCPLDWRSSELLIVHKNRKRIGRNSSLQNRILIDLSQWTAEQLANFEDFGRRKILEEYERLVDTPDSVVLTPVPFDDLAEDYPSLSKITDREHSILERIQSHMAMTPWLQFDVTPSVYGVHDLRMQHGTIQPIGTHRRRNPVTWDTSREE